MINSGLRVNKFHIVGFSLGAQLAGMIGREVKIKTNGIIELQRLVVEMQSNELRSRSVIIYF